MKRYAQVVLGVALSLAPASSYAISIPLSTTDATLNLNLQLQPQFLVNKAGTPDGMDPSYDVFVRRGRIPVHGTLGKSFRYYFQLDNPNFGKYGNLQGPRPLPHAWAAQL